jgi:hypothetical protein
MTRLLLVPAPAARRLKRALCAAACVAAAGLAWAGYGAGDSQAALALLWSLCTPS